MSVSNRANGWWLFLVIIACFCALLESYTLGLINYVLAHMFLLFGMLADVVRDAVRVLTVKR